MTYIADFAFNACEKLEAVDMRNVEKIDEMGFIGCYKLQHIAVNLDATLEDWAFDKVCQNSDNSGESTYGTLTVYCDGCSCTEPHEAKTTEEEEFVSKLQTAGLNSKVTVQFAPLDDFPSAQQEEQSDEQPPAPDNALARTILNLF